MGQRGERTHPQYRTSTERNHSRNMVGLAARSHSVTAFQPMNRETHMITRTLRVMESVACLTAAVALTVLPAWSQAGELGGVQTRVVSYSGLDLNSPAGARILYSRLRAAAYSACDAAESANTSARTSDDPCMRKALGDAVASVNRPQLTELYVARYHSAPAHSDFGISVASARGN
jgi:UrcA family protein